MYKKVALIVALESIAASPLFGEVTFSRDVAPVVFAKCARCHHPEGSAPFSLLTFASVRSRATLIAQVTKSRLMPPTKADPSGHEFVGLDPLTEAEIRTFEQWVSEGAREGDRRDLPEPPRSSGGWQLGTPDLVVTLPEPYILAADGPDVSRVFVLPVPVDRRRYVRGIEFRANSPRVHHANIRIDATPASREIDERDSEAGYDGIIVRSAVYPDGHFLGWTPGQVAPLLPAGLAWHLPPAGDLVVQLHMVPGGKPEPIRPSIGIYFTDEAPRQTPVMMRLSNQQIDIPAGDSNYVATDAFVLPVDVTLLAVQPHAHYLAREVTGMATLPDGRTDILIAIHDWDLRWQHVYRYERPVFLPKGTRVNMRYRYDNSAENPRNPSTPPLTVPWGQQSREEMGDLWLQVMPKDPADRQRLDEAFRAKWMSTDLIGLEALIARHPDRAPLRDDAAVLYMELNRPADALRHFEAAIELAPLAPAAHFNYATALAALGRFGEALPPYERALELRPSYAVAHNNRGVALLQLGRPKEALGAFREAVRIDPRLGDAHLNIGLLARARGDFPGAVEALRRAVAINDQWVTAISSLASLLAAAPNPSVRNPTDAVNLAERAASLTFRKDANTLDVLAVALAAAGDFDGAVKVTDEALALDPSTALASMIRSHRELFVASQPYIARQ